MLLIYESLQNSRSKNDVLSFFRSLREQVDRQKAKEQSECTFQPNLNLMTQSIGRAAPLDELVNNRRGQRVRERAQEKAR